MSVRTLSRVWDASQHGGTELLMLLAIADFADDDGRAYPAVAKLAKKCRTTPRHANRLLAALRDSGELEIRLNAGEHGQNRYRIRFDGMQRPTPLTPMSPLTDTSPLTPPSATPDVDVPKPLTCTSDKPSLNRQEPSGRRKPAKHPACPRMEIIATYHEVLPELPRVRNVESKGRAQVLDDFWAWLLSSVKPDGTRRATDAAEAMGWIRVFFERARANDFVMGRVPRAAGHESWEASLDYIVSDRGRTQILEKTKGVA